MTMLVILAIVVGAALVVAAVASTLQLRRYGELGKEPPLGVQEQREGDSESLRPLSFWPCIATAL
jgi:ABC-type antimicrobial peptide transport system permease subunit